MPPYGGAGKKRRKRRSSLDESMSSDNDDRKMAEAAAEHVFSRQEGDRYGLMRRIEEAATLGLRYVRRCPSGI